MANLKPSLKRFLKDATYKSGQEICQPTEHMNLLKENAVDIHVNTNAKELTFKVTDGEENAFLLAENMEFKVRDNKFGADEKFVTVVYDCTKNGMAHKRCEASRELPECTTEKTTNTIEVSNERGVLLSTCTVWVKGVKYGLSCEDSGSKGRRRLLQGNGGGES